MLSGFVFKMRNEPAVTLLCAAGSLLLLAATFVLVWQVLVRKAPLIEGSIILPPSANILPVGTVVAFFGGDHDVPNGWAVCEGQNNPQDSKIAFDANSEKPGIQLPDLRHKFIRGSDDYLETGLVQGGSDNVEMAHSHGLLPGLSVQPAPRPHPSIQPRPRLLTLPAPRTDIANIAREVDNRPEHVELRYIIKVQ